MTKQKIEARVCPYCGADTSNAYMDSEPVDDGRYWAITCPKCHQDFEEWYSEVFVGHRVGLNAGEDGVSEPDFLTAEPTPDPVKAQLLAACKSLIEDDLHSTTNHEKARAAIEAAEKETK